MAKLSILAGSTSQSVNIFIQDSSATTGAGLTGLVFNTSSLVAYYTFVSTNTAATAITLATLAAANSAYSSGGFKEISSANMPGLYRLDIPDAALAASSGRSCVIMLKGATNMAPCVLEIELTAINNQSTGFGLSNVSSNVVQWNGTNVSSPATAGIPEVNVKNINNVAAATPGASGGVLISGSNSGTTTLGALTVTGATTHTGNVVMAAGLNITQSSSNISALVVTGNGTGSGAVFTSGSGATGDGIQATSAATNGNGFVLTGLGTGNALKATPGLTGAGVSITGGGTSGRGIDISTTSGIGISVAATLGEGIKATSTSTNAISGLGGSAGAGFFGQGGSTGAGMKAQGGTNGIGFSIQGGGTSGDAVSIGSISGNGVTIAPTAGHGISITANGTSKHGITSTGGTAGTSDGIKAVAGSGGVDIRGAITGDVTGNLSGSVGSVTGLTASNLDATISSRMATYTQPTGFLAATFPSGTVANTTNITAGTITTVTNLTNAPTAGDFTATMKTSLNAATPAVTVSDKTGFSLTSAYDFAKGTVAPTESYAALHSVPTPVQAILEIRSILAESAIAGTTRTSKKVDGSTTAATYTLDSSSSPTSITRAS